MFQITMFLFSTKNADLTAMSLPSTPIVRPGTSRVFYQYLDKIRPPNLNETIRIIFSGNLLSLPDIIEAV